MLVTNIMSGGGLNACQDGLGHLFREELSKFKGAFAYGGASLSETNNNWD